MKIGILSLPFSANYGYLLQSWALSMILKSMGYEVEVLSRGWNRKEFSFVYKTKRWIYYNILCKKLFEFYKNINRSELIRSSENLKKYVINNKFDAVIVGSDQVWRVKNVRGADLNFFLDFIEDKNEIKKISYAASFGTDKFEGTEDELQKIKKLLPLFNHISVREQSGVDICKNLFNVNSDLVVDPTLLLSSKIYIQNLKLKENKTNKITTYILDSNQEKTNIISTISKELNSSPINLYQKRFGYYSVEYWLEQIMNANFVIVDSFHGMVFSLIFNKEFLVINNKTRGATRFLNLLSQLGLEFRIIEEDIEQTKLISIINQKIDYTQVNNRLSSLVDNSMNKLKDYLK